MTQSVPDLPTTRARLPYQEHSQPWRRPPHRLAVPFRSVFDQKRTVNGMGAETGIRAETGMGGRDGDKGRDGDGGRGGDGGAGGGIRRCAVTIAVPSSAGVTSKA